MASKRHLKINSHKKRKDSLETQAVLLVFLLELEISGVAVQGIHQNSEKWLLPVRILLVKMTLRLFLPLSVVMTMMPTPLRQLRRSLQIKKIITNLSINNSKNGWFLGHPQSIAKKTLHRKKSNN